MVPVFNSNGHSSPRSSEGSLARIFRSVVIADEIQANIPSGNGERLELKIGSKSLGIAAKDVVSVLVMLGAFAGFYLVAESLRLGQTRGFDGLAQILEKMNVNQQQSLDRMAANQQTLLELVHTNRAQMMEQLTQQNEQVNQQTAALQTAVTANTLEVSRRLAVLNFNLSREPGDRVPLELTPDELKKPTR